MSNPRSLQAGFAWAIALTCSVAFVIGIFRVSDSFRAFAIKNTIFATVPVPHDAEGRTNILLLGIGDPEHSAANLTDAMIIASIDPASNSITMLSIPRDLTVVDANGYPHGRINALYAIAKKEFRTSGKTDTEVSILSMEDVAADIAARTGMSIQAVATMDFSGFEQVIDAFGGIDVTVPEKIVDTLYPLKEGGVGTIVIEAGAQHMNGVQSLQYARSRHSTSDFDRSRRQQQILSALEKTIKSKDFAEDIAVARSLQTSLKKHFQTTLQTTELFGLAVLAASVRSDRIISLSLNFSVGGDYSDSEAGGFVVPAPAAIAGSAALIIPRSVSGEPGDWSDISTLATMLMTKRKIYLQHPTFVIDYASPRAQAQRLRNELVRYGFGVSSLSKNMSIADGASAIVLGPAADMDTAAFFAALLSLPVADVEGPKPSPVYRIVLDKDYVFTPFSASTVDE